MDTVGSWIVAAFLGYVSLIAPAYSATCAAGLVEVEADREDAVALVCDAVDEVLRSLEKCGLLLRRPFRVQIVPQLPPAHERHYLGFFDRRAEQVVVLEYDRCITKMGSGGRFDVPMTPALYRSLLVHEIAHALIEQNRTASRLNRAAHEYAAYAIQFASMDPTLRNRIQASFPHAAPIADSELSTLYLDLSPPDFAVKAYLHFRMPANGCGFLHGLLRGERSLPSGLE